MSWPQVSGEAGQRIWQQYHSINLWFIKKSFPLREAIAFGDVSWADHISYGRAIIDAYYFANDQEWIGTICQNGLPHID